VRVVPIDALLTVDFHQQLYPDLSRRTLFSPEILCCIHAKIVDEPTLPTPFLRTVVSICPSSTRKKHQSNHTGQQGPHTNHCNLCIIHIIVLSFDCEEVIWERGPLWSAGLFDRDGPHRLASLNHERANWGRRRNKADRKDPSEGVYHSYNESLSVWGSQGHLEILNTEETTVRRRPVDT
jgi:hypothetical protein